MSERVAVGILVAVVPVRIALDLLWAVDTAGVSLAEAAGAVLALVPAALAALRWRAAASHPLRWPMAAFAACVVLGAARAGSAADAARYGLHLLMPVGWLLALHAWWGDRGVPRVWGVAAAVPVGLSLVALATGQPAEHVLHGWPRLLGPYGNLHTAAATMAVVTASAGILAVARRDVRDAALALTAGFCALLTWVRGAFLWIAVAWGLALLQARRVGAAAGLALVGLAALVASGRGADLASVLTLTPPPGGWDALGSWRIRIWSGSLRAFLGGPADEIWLGRGLGGQYGLHRHLDPHSDVLSLLYQLGPIGLLAWLAWVGGALVLLARRRDPVAAAAFGVLGGALAVSLVGNDFLLRASAATWTWGLVGIALSSRPR